MDGMIKIDFTIQEGPLRFTDALNLPEDHGLSAEDIEALKQERFNRWKDAVYNPPVYPENPETEPTPSGE